MSRSLTVCEQRVVVWAVQGWRGALVAVTLVAGFLAYIDGEIREHTQLVFWVFALLSLGLIGASWPILTKGRLGGKAADQKQRLRNFRTLAGVHALLGVSIIGAIQLIGFVAALEDHLMIMTVVWLIPAIAWFVSYWGLARIA